MSMIIIRFRSRWIVLETIAIFLLILAKWGWVSPDFSEKDCSLEQNAAWISVDWTSKPSSKAAISQLAQQATNKKIRYLYPYTTYVKPDGTFNPTYDFAADFVSQLRELNQETLVLAWVGVPLENSRQVGIQGWVDLSDENERQDIVDFVTELVTEADFDGVHLNVETVPDNDPYFLLLLDEVRSTLGSGRILSVAGAYWLPQVINDLPFVEGYRWSGAYYQAIADRVDQIATMTYDSLMPYPVLYRLWLREQVRGISVSLADEEVELLIGVSVSRENTVTHKPEVENMPSGLAGICAGKSMAGHPIDGVAIYAAWEAEENDWQIWDNWLATSSRAGK